MKRDCTPSPLDDRQLLALEELLGRIAPKILVIMNIAPNPKDPAALGEEMRVLHERVEEIAPLFASEPDTQKAILAIGQLGGGAVSLGPRVPVEIFERFTVATGVLNDALVKRQTAYRASNQDETLPAKPLAILQYLEWLRLHGRRRWKLVILGVVGLIIVILAIYYGPILIKGWHPPRGG